MNPDRASTRSPTSGEPLLRIGAVGARTGLSSHVIRVWERRYDAVIPHRTPGGTRMYDVRHVERLKLLAELTESGYAISAIAPLDDARLRSLLEGLAAGDLSNDNELPQPWSPDASADVERQVAVLLNTSLAQLARFDLDAATATLHSALGGLPRQAFLTEIVEPAVRTVSAAGELSAWSVAHRHALYSALRTVLGSMIRTHRPEPGARVAVVGALSGDPHDFGALRAALESAAAGWKTLYMGSSLPAGQLLSTAVAARASALVLSLAAPPSPEGLGRLREIQRQLPGHARMLLIDDPVSGWSPLVGATSLSTLNELRAHLNGAMEDDEI